MPTSAANTYHFGPFEVNPSSGELLKAGRRVKLQDQPFRLLVILLENAGQIVSREEIQKRIWQGNTFGDFDSGLRVAVRKLRDALDDNAEQPRYIETIPKRGYRLIAAPATQGLASPAESAASIKDDGPSQVPVQPSIPRIKLIGRRWILPALLALLAVLLATSLYFAHGPRKLAGADVIVLADFANSTGDPVFDGTLRQGVAVQLQQSPFLNLLSDERISKALLLMGRQADARLTPEVALDLCLRTGSAAVLDGSISRLGTQYVIGLRARGCQNNEVLDQEQAEAARKEDVLKALDQIGSSFRSRVGESLASVEKHSMPLEEATTPSLDALKAYSTAIKVAFSSGWAASIPHMQRAVELDPNFALAYAHLGLWYSSVGESELARQSTKRAYELRNRASDREKFFITAMYERDASGNLEKAYETLRLWAQTYPHDVIAHGLLSGFSAQGTGRYQEAIEEGQKAVSLDADFTPGYLNIATSNFYLDRFDDAQRELQLASQRKLEIAENLLFRYQLAVLNKDESEMQRVSALASGKAGAEDWMTHCEALALAQSGRLRAARAASARAVELARSAGQKERAATYLASAAVWEGLFGNVSNAKRQARAALTMSAGRDVEYAAAIALALAGDVPRSKQLANDLERRFPEDSSVQLNYLPALRGMLALRDGTPEKALQMLQPAIAHELAIPAVDFNYFFGGVYPAYARGEVLLALNRGSEAVTEFNKILNHRGLVAADPIVAVARIKLAEAYKSAGERTQSDLAYSDFLSFWKNADRDVPMLHKASDAP